MLYVKFGSSPEFKGQPAPGFADHWESRGFVDLDHDDDGEPIDAHVTRHLIEKYEERRSQGVPGAAPMVPGPSAAL